MVVSRLSLPMKHSRKQTQAENEFYQKGHDSTRHFCSRDLSRLVFLEENLGPGWYFFFKIHHQTLPSSTFGRNIFRQGLRLRICRGSDPLRPCGRSPGGPDISKQDNGPNVSTNTVHRRHLGYYQARSVPRKPGRLE